MSFLPIPISKRKFPIGFIVFSSIILILIFIIENINHRFWLNDFRVYYSAADAFFHDKPVYGKLFSLGSGYYKYSPFTCILFIPLSFLPYSVASITHYFIVSVTVVFVFIVTWNILNKHLFNESASKTSLLLSVVFISSLTLLIRELHLGNVNLVLLLLLCLTLLCILNSQATLAGVLFALVLITKPFFILLIIPLFLRKNYRVIIAAGISGLFFVLIPAFFTGMSNNIQLHKEWLTTIAEHNSSFPTDDTLLDIIRSNIWMSIPDVSSYYILAMGCLMLVLFYIINKLNEQKKWLHGQHEQAGLIMEWFVCIAIIPSLFKTDTEHFLFSIPLLIIITYFVFKTKNVLLFLPFVILVWMYEGNSSDLLGKDFSLALSSAGVLGISNLIILAGSIVAYFKIIASNQLSFQTKEKH